MLRNMDRRLHNSYAIEASLHGIKVPLRHNLEKAKQDQDLEDLEFDPKIAEQAMLDAQSRVRSRYG